MAVLAAASKMESELANKVSSLPSVRYSSVPQNALLLSLEEFLRMVHRCIYGRAAENAHSSSSSEPSSERKADNASALHPNYKYRRRWREDGQAHLIRKGPHKKAVQGSSYTTSTAAAARAQHATPAALPRRRPLHVPCGMPETRVTDYGAAGRLGVGAGCCACSTHAHDTTAMRMPPPARLPPPGSQQAAPRTRRPSSSRASRGGREPVDRVAL